MAEDALARVQAAQQAFDTGDEPQQEERPETWRPRSDEHPSAISGTLRAEPRTIETKYGPRQLITLDGEQSFDVFLAAVLAEEFERQQPRPGDTVAVAFLGDRTNQSGTTYGLYAVEVDRAEGGEAGWVDAPPAR